MEFFSWKRLIIQCYNLLCKKEARAIEWVQIVLQNCEKLQNYRAKKEKILSEVCMIKKGPHSTVYLRRVEKTANANTIHE